MNKFSVKSNLFVVKQFHLDLDGLARTCHLQPFRPLSVPENLFLTLAMAFQRKSIELTDEYLPLFRFQAPRI